MFPNLTGLQANSHENKLIGTGNVPALLKSSCLVAARHAIEFRIDPIA